MATGSPPKSGFLSFLSDFPGVTFLKSHEKLIIVIILVVAGLHFWSMGLNAWEKHDEKQLAGLQAQVNADKAAAAASDQQRLADAQTAAADRASYQQTLAATQAQIAALQAAILARDKATQQQQQTDLHASIPELSARFSSLVPGVNPQDIQISADQKSVTVGTDTAEKTVAQLELVPELQADLKDAQSENTSLQTEIKSLQTYNGALEAEVATDDKEIALLNKELADADKTCQAEVNLEKAKTKKAFMHGLKIGAILGFFGGLFGAHAAGY